jgi:predicted transcriptional regulator
MTIPSQILNQKEYKVYLYLLERGATTAHNIYMGLNKNISRTTVYEILDNLLKKKLIYIDHKKRKINIYAPQTPTRLLELVDNKLSEINKIKSNIKKLLPHLENKYVKLSEMPEVQFFEGEEGIKQLISSSREGEFAQDEIRLNAFCADSVEEKAPYHKDDKRDNPKFKYKVIYTYSKGKIDVLHSNPNYDSVYITKKGKNSKDMKMPAELLIYDGKVGFLDIKKNIGIVITNKSICQTLSSLFNLLFSYIKKDKNLCLRKYKTINTRKNKLK